MKVLEKYKEKRGILAKKRIAYEIEILDFNERLDVFDDGQTMKVVYKQGIGNYTPTDSDDVCVCLKLVQDESIKYNNKNWHFSVGYEKQSKLIKQIVLSCKFAEESFTEVTPEILKLKMSNYMKMLK